MEKCFVRYLRTRCFCIRNLTRSLRSLVRFLIRQQLVRKYRTPALSMKYSLLLLCGHGILFLNTGLTIFKAGVYGRVIPTIPGTKKLPDSSLHTWKLF